MDDEDPWVITGIDSEVPLPQRPTISSSVPQSYCHGAQQALKAKSSRGNKIRMATWLAELTANAIAEAMYASCDDDGNEYFLFDCIVDHKKNGKALTNKTQPMSHNGKESMRCSTAGWHLCVQWLDGSTS